MKRFVLLAFALGGAAACGDNLDAHDHDHEIDAPQIDAAIDAPVDAPIDAPVATHSGTISVFDVVLRNMGGAGVDGHGIQVGISFTDNAAVNAPIMQESPSPIDGCKLWEYDMPAEFAANLGGDEGAVQITAGDGSPVFPACIYAGASTGYICPDTASSGTGGVLAPASAATATFTVPAGSSAVFGAEDAGRYLKLGSTGVAALDTAFPIVAFVSANTVVIAGTNATLTLPVAATFTTLAGVGPVPAGGTAPTDPMGDGENLTFAKAAGTHFEAFPANLGFGGAAGIGDVFTLGTANGKVLPTSIPTDGSAFTVGCDDAGSCGTALGSILNIVTTNASTLGVPSPFYFPTGTRRIQIRCIKVGATTITVPAAYSAHLTRAMSGANRIQATFIRTNQAGAMNMTGAPNQALIAGGHAEVGFTTVMPQM